MLGFRKPKGKPGEAPRRKRAWELDQEEDVKAADEGSERQTSKAFLQLRQDLEARAQRVKDAEKRQQEGTKTPARAAPPSPPPPPDRICVFLDIETKARGKHAVPVGRLKIELFNDLVPRTAENFRSLCSGDHRGLWYRDNIFHRIIPGFMAQGGDITREDGSGGRSIYGETFEDESLLGKHDKPGILSMANSGRHTNNSQFFLTFKPTPWLDGKHVVFGEVVAGFSVLKSIERAGSKEGEPKEQVIIASCGAIPSS
uniref:Peptidyl-prolyl cis-trans isomerase n=1 Tax=Rhizochromulina marina TaxID=1034831 RepID=A0A7S2SRD0_9STRA|mmetsp:Transcript_5184/g.15228  ORF Transcript_5184/g.15228 Transcript_5184/m.15228 type:complete len:257 (+) Transcript_5184:223-993(+)